MGILNRNKTMMITLMFITVSINAQTVVNVSTLSDFKAALSNSNQIITLAAGDYAISDLSDGNRYFLVSGDSNIINLDDVTIDIPVELAPSDFAHFTFTGNGNTLKNGTIQNSYKSGIETVTDYVAYNKDRTYLANGAKPHFVIYGDSNTIKDTKMFVRGSFPYGYGSEFGIGAGNFFGLDKKAAMQINGKNTTIDGVDIRMGSFGHGIYVGPDGDDFSPVNTVVKNCYIEGVVRTTDDMKAEYDASDTDGLVYRAFNEDGYTIPAGEANSLSEDAIRVYTGGGDITVDNCIVKEMRGGVRLWLASAATVTNTTTLGCGETNIHLPRNGTATGATANFKYGPALTSTNNKSGTTVEVTLVPSPDAVGSHDIATLADDDHDITFYRTAGPIDTAETRVVSVQGNNSTIDNETEYTIVLEAGTSGNTITSCGPVIDNGTGNNVSELSCNFDFGCGEPQVYEIVDTFSSQNNLFTYSYNVTTSGTVNNGVIGLSGDVNADAFNDMATIVQFNDDGFIKVRNGGVYEADQSLAWTQGQTYSVLMDVDILNQKYSVHVSAGSDTIVLATDYSFRSDWITTSYLDRTVVKTNGCPLNVSGGKAATIDLPTKVWTPENLILDESATVVYHTLSGEKTNKKTSGLLIVKSHIPGQSRIKIQLLRNP